MRFSSIKSFKLLPRGLADSVILALLNSWMSQPWYFQAVIKWYPAMRLSCLLFLVFYDIYICILDLVFKLFIPTQDQNHPKFKGEKQSYLKFGAFGPSWFINVCPQKLVYLAGIPFIPWLWIVKNGQKWPPSWGQESRK